MKGMLIKDLRLLTGGKESYFNIVFAVLFLGVLGIALDGKPGDNFGFECAVIAVMAWDYECCGDRFYRMGNAGLLDSFGEYREIIWDRVFDHRAFDSL